MKIEFPLAQRRDRNGTLYLFASLDMFSCVFFVYPDPDRTGHYIGRVKAYQSPADREKLEAEEVWKE